MHDGNDDENLNLSHSYACTIIMHLHFFIPHLGSGFYSVFVYSTIFGVFVVIISLRNYKMVRYIYSIYISNTVETRGQ